MLPFFILLFRYCYFFYASYILTTMKKCLHYFALVKLLCSHIREFNCNDVRSLIVVIVFTQ